MKNILFILTVLVMGFVARPTHAQPYVFDDFVGTWHGTISSQTYPPYSDPMTMVIYDNHFYTETSGHLMPTIYPNTQECDYEASTNRFHWWYLQTVYAGQHFYQHFYYEVVYFSNDTLEMHYNFWDDPMPHPEVGTIFLVRENNTPQPANLTAQLNAQSIQLNWTAPTNIPSGSTLQGYNIYYAFNNASFSVLDYVPSTSYIHGGYFQSGLHEYYVTAVYNVGESNPSNEVTVQTTANTPIGDFQADKLMPSTTDLVVFTDLSTYSPTAWSWEFTPSTVEYQAGTGPYSQHPVVRFTQAGTYTVQLWVENLAGLDSEVKYNYINVSDGLSVAIQTMTPELCAGESAQLSAIVSGGSGYYTYTWTSNPPGFYASQSIVDVTPDATTTYMVEVFDGTLTSYEEQNIVVNPMPEITLLDWPDELCKYGGEPVQLMAYPEGGVFTGPYITPDGLFDPSMASIGWNVIVYTFESEYGCIASQQDSIYVDNCTGLNDALDNDPNVMIYPNPSTDVINIESNHLFKSLKLYNCFGQMVKTMQMDQKSYRFDVASMESGMYILVMTTANDVIKRRIVIQ
jgi:PKD repeat protein